MSTIITAAGESLLAQLQAEGKPLVIDEFIFAHIPGQDHTGLINPNTGVPENEVVFRYAIPAEYKAFIGPNQVVYSAMLGSDIGDFALNWQGLYCGEHEVLVAVSTFPRLEKRAANEMENQTGNNITRNFMLEFSGAREATGITVEAEVWQLDFSLRLHGIDERERLSNRDLYGRASFFQEAWKLEAHEGGYAFHPGLAYVEGIRAELETSQPLVDPALPCSVWLDVSLEPSSSDLVTVVQTVVVGDDDEPEDYDSPEPVRVRHYLQKVAEIDAEGRVTDLRTIVASDGDVMRVVNGRVEWAKSDGMPLLTVFYDPSSLAKPGFLNASVDNGLLSRAAFPQAAAEIQRRYEAGDTAVVTDQEWLNEFGVNDGACARFSIGDGTSTFRLPVLAGLYPGAPDGSEKQTPGGYLGDAIRNITGRLDNPLVGGAIDNGQVPVPVNPQGVFLETQPGSQMRFHSYNSGGYAYWGGWIDFNAANSVPIAEVNRPRTALMTPFIKMYGAVTRAEEANIAELIRQTTELKGKVEAVRQYELCEVYYFRNPTLRPGFRPAQGGLLENAATLYPEAWAYLQSLEGQKLCKTEAEWQALTRATWATLADGTKIGWNGIGGAPFFALNKSTGALRLPDLRGMYAEAAGFDGLGIGGVHGDAIRQIIGAIASSEDPGNEFLGDMVYSGGALSATLAGTKWGISGSPGWLGGVKDFNFAASRVVPTANKVQTRAWGALACVYLGVPK